MQGTAGEVRTSLYAILFNELLHEDTPVLADQPKLTFISPKQTLDAVLRTCHERW